MLIDVGGRCVGTVGFVNTNSKWATLSIEIFDPALWGRGLGTEATNLALGVAFDSLNMHRVELNVYAYNTRAIRACEKCGFVREGVSRESSIVDGQWEDKLNMSILDREYRALAAGKRTPDPAKN